MRAFLSVAKAWQEGGWVDRGGAGLELAGWYHRKGDESMDNVALFCIGIAVFIGIFQIRALHSRLKELEVRVAVLDDRLSRLTGCRDSV